MYKSKFLKISILFLAVILVVSLSLFGCKKEAAPAEEVEEAVEEVAEEEAVEEVAKEEAANTMTGELEVGVLYQSGAWYDVVTEIGDSMIKDFPGVKMRYTFNNTAAAAANQARTIAGDPLDVDYLFSSLDPSSYDWVDNNYVLDITDAMNEVRDDGTMWKDDFPAGFLNSGIYKDKIWGAPVNSYVYVLHYNKKMFDDWGKTPPKTWDEMIELCNWIKTNGDGVAPIAVTGQYAPYAGFWWDYLIQRYVSEEKVKEYLYGDTDLKLADDPNYLKAAQEMSKLSENGYLIDGWEATDFTTAQLYFFQGKAAMMLMGSWLMSEMKDSIPEGFEMAVLPFPSVEGGAGSQDALFGAVYPWSVMAGSDVPDLATEYLRRFTSKEACTKRAELLGSLSCTLGVPAPAGIGGIDKLLDDLRNADLNFGNHGIGSAKFGVEAAFYTPIIEMWMGKITPEETLAKIDKNFESVREQRKAAGE